MISNQMTVVATPEQVSSALVGESVILNLKTGMYYGLNPVGASIWELLQQPKSVDDLYQAILHEYEVEPEQCHRELLTLLDDLLAAQLIEIQEINDGCQ